jgi:hypothetical protein
VDSNSIFDAAYWNAQPPPVEALQNIAGETQRQAAAQALAQNGQIIDLAIMVWGWEPWKVMTLRQSYGYTWVPNIVQPNVTAAPGVTGPNIVPYNPADPPPGSIKVSTNLADYPPYTPPAQPPAPPATLPAGAFLTPDGYVAIIGLTSGGGIYPALAGDNVPDGHTVTAPGGNQYMRHVALLLGGAPENWYTLLS